ncbi:hypothetical protein DFA_01829 [Cavenderia fasciculata]|uniref:Uncharacterized protein n=1 Tax=Cavenderia fasciculata TaxID=261658 RepID=F4PUY1_CACFS|nr:uncharacterized protein DFA_01829 [Cavenderia fasciculata]EGG21943.1 hypothetical protein DFA_01829 [Cavenderia fasciculata]|eukprot:XP_004359794.1 hypothetical protein DFA_01829 [Cavenderia fasciculata]
MKSTTTVAEKPNTTNSSSSSSSTTSTIKRQQLLDGGAFKFQGKEEVRDIRKTVKPPQYKRSLFNAYDIKFQFEHVTGLSIYTDDEKLFIYIVLSLFIVLMVTGIWRWIDKLIKLF